MRFYSAQVLLTLDYLHSQEIVHCDLKPENIVIGEKGYIRLIDLGISKVIGDPDKVDCPIGEYTPPEIIRGRHYTRSGDWWHLGILIYEMIVGHSPYASNSQNKEKMKYEILEKFPLKNDFISKHAFDLILKLLVKDPTRRLGHAREDVGKMKKHPFFKGVDWQLLWEKRIRPPFTKFRKLGNFDQKLLVAVCCG